MVSVSQFLVLFYMETTSVRHEALYSDPWGTIFLSLYRRHQA
jgi:hypothetical protein